MALEIATAHLVRALSARCDADPIIAHQSDVASVHADAPGLHAVERFGNTITYTLHVWRLAGNALRPAAAAEPELPPVAAAVARGAAIGVFLALWTWFLVMVHGRMYTCK